MALPLRAQATDEFQPAECAAEVVVADDQIGQSLTAAPGDGFAGTGHGSDGKTLDREQQARGITHAGIVFNQ